MCQSSQRQERHGARGSSIVPTLVIVVGLTVLSLAALNLATRGTISAAHKAHGDQLTACANAAAQRVLAEYALSGVTVSTITAAGIPGGPTLGLGHFDGDMTATIKGNLVELSPAAGGQTPADFDTTNTILGSSLGGKPYSVSAHCTDGQGRQYEVELFVRLGLM